MSKKDWLRSRIEAASKAYRLAHTPPIPRVWKESKDESNTDVDVDEMHREHQRLKLLVFALDIKYPLKAFLDDLEANHGSKRREMFLDWVKGGWADCNSLYGERKRELIRSDIKILKRKFKSLRLNKSDELAYFKE